jgi:hypothetical protein
VVFGVGRKEERNGTWDSKDEEGRQEGLHETEENKGGTKTGRTIMKRKGHIREDI